MADDVKPRAVSGEIMTDAAQGPAERAAPGTDIIDADYISLPAQSGIESPADAHKALGPAAGTRSAAPPAGGMDMLRRKETKAPPPAPARGGPLFWTVGFGLALAAFWVSGGHALVSAPPFVGERAQSALRISGVTSRVDPSGRRPILLVDGEAANDGRTVEHLPALEVIVTGNDGLVTRYRLGTAGRPIAPGETFAFSSRLDAPKNGVRTVSVAFAE